MECSVLTLTWYPGAVGETGGTPRVLLAAGDWCDAGNQFAVLGRQLVQTDATVRGAAVTNTPRGNQAIELSWTRHLEYDTPNAVIEALLGDAAVQSDQTGWVLVEIADIETTWSLSEAVLEVTGGRLDTEGQTALFQHVLKAGALAVYSGDPPASLYTGELLECPVSGDRGAILLFEPA